MSFERQVKSWNQWVQGDGGGYALVSMPRSLQCGIYCFPHVADVDVVFGIREAHLRRKIVYVIIFKMSSNVCIIEQSDVDKNNKKTLLFYVNYHTERLHCNDRQERANCIWSSCPVYQWSWLTLWLRRKAVGGDGEDGAAGDLKQ